MSLYSEADEKRRESIPQKRGLEKENYRSEWRRDYGRIIHSAAFRRLQGKTQLFPYFESDFFRNRLTHSLEVAQIAKSIAVRINNTQKFFKERENQIQLDITEIAGLAHDLGHPPFGHNGEKALDECMKKYGGFEGNAQTLRILTKIEKRQKKMGSSENGIDLNGGDQRLGLNPTYRTLASILKYDEQIPKERECGDIIKGYYYSESSIVDEIKLNVLGVREYNGTFKTIECQIMDIADDIAYSTYDLEDAFKAGFISPLDMIAIDDVLANEIAKEVSKTIKSEFGVQDVKDTIFEIFAGVFKESFNKLKKYINLSNYKSLIPLISEVFEATNSIANNGYLRTRFSSFLVESFIQAIQIKINDKYPPLTEISLKENKLIQMETLKRFTYAFLINSSKLKVAQYRGQEIVRRIFEALSDDSRHGYELMPEDFQDLYHSFKNVADKKRVICDFIAGMTDRYVLEFYGRLTSENPQTIFKPL